MTRALHLAIRPFVPAPVVSDSRCGLSEYGSDASSPPKNEQPDEMPAERLREGPAGLLQNPSEVDLPPARRHLGSATPRTREPDVTTDTTPRPRKISATRVLMPGS
jgi:hypothetical protein